MPNNVQNLINFDCEEERYKEIVNFMKSEDSEFDFNKLIPMPKELNLVEGGFDGEYVQCYVASLTKGEANDVINLLKNTKDDYYGNYYKKYFDRRIYEMTEDRIKWMNEKVEEEYSKFNAHSFADVGKLYVDNIRKYGCATWYKWCIRNWGTKWNSYDVYWGQDDDQLVCFSTAWESVPNIVLELSRRFPEVDMEYNWADEDIGYNVGRVDILNGEVTNECVPEGGTKEAYELAFDLQGCEDMFEYDEDKGTYVYCEE